MEGEASFRELSTSPIMGNPESPYQELNMSPAECLTKGLTKGETPMGQAEAAAFSFPPSFC